MDAITLARMQFAANITFHILFPTITIALGWVLLFLRWRYLRAAAADTQQAWLNAYRFWTKVFALSFALGVVSGVTMSFQFGTNWPGFMERAGDVAGPLLAYEVLTAFFLEAGFLGVMLFGHGRVSERVHLMATFFVAFGTTLSAFWILALNSWMQTPTGHEVIDGRFVVVSWWQVMFNPSFPYRFTHMLLASALTCAFLLSGLSAWQLLKGSASGSAPKVLRVGLTLAALLIPLQIVVGDQHGLNTLEHQPQKVAAMEGLWQTTRGAPLLLFAVPDGTARANHFEVAVPKLASLILRHDLDGEVKGLDDFRDQHPPVFAVFWAFRVMVGMGLADARHQLARLVAVSTQRLGGRSAAARAAGLAGGDDVRRLGRHRGRLVRHRDRPPAVHRLRPAAHRRRRIVDRSAADRPDAGVVRRRVCRAGAGLRGGAEIHGRETGTGAGQRGRRTGCDTARRDGHRNGGEAR